MGLFDFFSKKNDIENGIDQLEREREAAEGKLCAKCGHKYPLETEYCTRCNTPLYVENENFCVNPDCQRYLEQYEFAHDDFVCDKCGTPTVVGNICGFNDPID